MLRMRVPVFRYESRMGFGMNHGCAQMIVRVEATPQWKRESQYYDAKVEGMNLSEQS
ncbi:predicted protein [Sclerotinia sclerotiorum 1980 UF-70]|uniref:Uncharacterized protein n=1 Tax=Sclerotinia sclerotiorum (strain ATCC 18683 / 1980 / Ss-1) TaxID=665079 RepID=A7E6T3_SCLS1|nr:predicted protein [Sclerotinia sclerotiorum 1980 UF-70]EDN91605.1 predicted protein [Sclerotinia sclerotiorum 1980 UF-70]